MPQNSSPPPQNLGGPFNSYVEAEKKYSWCSCGLSKIQPFCDGSHKGSEMKSVSFTPETSQTVSLCGCKKTQNPPFCDGSHHSL